MMEFNMTDSLHIQITFGPFSFIGSSAKNLVKDGPYEFFSLSASHSAYVATATESNGAKIDGF